jgi:diguanylate cyclase (GGDEF)-like protein/PAS domain S-box-containing protein
MNLTRQFSAVNAALGGIVKEVPGWRSQKDGAQLAAQHLKALNDAMPGVLTFLIFDADGTIRASDKQQLVGVNFSTRDYFQAVVKSPHPDRLYVWQPFTTKLGNFTMNLIRMIPDSKGAFDGMVVAGLDAEEFKVLLQSVVYRPDTRVALVHSDGVPFLMAPTSKHIGGLQLVEPGGLFTKHMQSGNPTSVLRGKVASDGEEKLVALKTISLVPLKADKSMVVAVDRPWDSIFSRWNKDVSQALALYVSLIIAAAVILTLRQRHRIRENRADLSREAERAGNVRALHESDQRFRRLTSLSSDWYWEQDENFRFVPLHGDIDPKTQAANEAHVGKTRWEMGALNLTEADWNKHRAMLANHQEIRDFVMQRHDPSGAIIWISTSGIPLFDADGTFRGYQGVAKDITASKLIEERIKHLAFYDGLTHLPNRRLLNDRLAVALATCKRNNLFGALLFIDLDDFKPINDRYGHETGDKLLMEVSNRLKSCVREIDTAARLGGDEFIVVVSDLDADVGAAKALALAIAEKIRSEFAQPYWIAGVRNSQSDGTVAIHCTASVGVTLLSPSDEDADELIKRADSAMYGSKDAGRNRVQFHDLPESVR